MEAHIGELEDYELSSSDEDDDSSSLTLEKEVKVEVGSPEIAAQLLSFQAVKSLLGSPEHKKDTSEKKDWQGLHSILEKANSTTFSNRCQFKFPLLRTDGSGEDAIYAAFQYLLEEAWQLPKLQFILQEVKESKTETGRFQIQGVFYYNSRIRTVQDVTEKWDTALPFMAEKGCWLCLEDLEVWESFEANVDVYGGEDSSTTIPPSSPGSGKLHFGCFSSPSEFSSTSDKSESPPSVFVRNLSLSMSSFGEPPSGTVTARSLSPNAGSIRDTFADPIISPSAGSFNADFPDYSSDSS